MHDCSDYIAHHGVKGMKWGVRKDRFRRIGERASFAKNKIKKRVEPKVVRYKKSIKGEFPISEDAEKVREIRQKPVKSMSNQELSTVIKRMNLEQQYRDLSYGSKNRGKHTVDDMLKYAKTANEVASLYKKVRGLG